MDVRVQFDPVVCRKSFERFGVRTKRALVVKDKGPYYKLLSSSEFIRQTTSHKRVSLNLYSISCCQVSTTHLLVTSADTRNSKLKFLI